MSRNVVFGMKCGARKGSCVDVFFFAADPVTGKAIHNKIVATDLRAPRSRWFGRFHLSIRNEDGDIDVYDIKWVDTKWNYL